MNEAEARAKILAVDDAFRDMHTGYAYEICGRCSQPAPALRYDVCSFCALNELISHAPAGDLARWVWTGQGA